MEVVLKDGGFDVDGGVEKTMIQAHNVQKCHLGGGGMPSEVNFFG